MPASGISAGTAYIKFQGQFSQLASQLAATLAPTRMNKLGKLGGAGLAAGVVAGAGIAAVKLSADFEKAMRNVNSIAQLPEKQFKRLNDQVLDLAGKTAQAPQTLAEGLYDLVSSGFDANESIKILEKSARAATAGLTDTATSTKVVASVLNAYRKPAKQAGAVSDILFRTVDRGVITFEELASTLGQTTPLAAQLKVPLEEVGAAIATMTKQGLSGAEANTRLRGILVQMVKPTEGLEAAFKELGVASGEDLIAKTGSLQKALVELIGTTDGSKEAVGEMFTNQRALIGALALTGPNAKEAAKDLKGMQDASGATARALEQQSKSFSFQLQKMSANIKAVAIRLGSVLLPALSAVAKEINLIFLGKSDIGKFFDDLIPKGEGGAGSALGDIAQAFEDVFNALQPVAEELLPIFEQNLRGTIRVLGGLAQVISGIVTLDIGKIGEGLGDIFAGLKDVALSRLRLATLPFLKLGEVVGKAFAAGLRAAFSVVRDVVLAVGGFLRKYTPFGILIDGAIKLGRWLRGVLPDVWAVVKKGIKALWEWAKKYSLPALIIRAWREVIKFLRGPVGDVWEWLKGAVSDAAKFALKALAGLLDGIAKVADAGSKLPGPLGDAWDKVQTGAEDAKKAVDGIVKSLDRVDRKKDRIRALGRGFKDLDEDATKSERSMKKWVRNLDQQLGKGRQISRKELKAIAKALGKGTQEGGKASDKNMSGFVGAVAEALNITKKNVKKALSAFGGSLGDFKDYDVQSKKRSQSFATPRLSTFAVGGTVVPGGRSGDRNLLSLNGVPIAMVEDQEGIYVTNRSAQSYLSAVNSMIPRRARGGMVEPPGDPGSEVVNAAIAAQVGSFFRRYGMNLTAGYDPNDNHRSPGHNVTGTALDVIPLPGESWTGRFEDGLRAAVRAGKTVLYGTAGIGQPYDNHGRYNHAHIEWGMGGNVAGGGAAASLPKVTLTGPDGPFLWHGQAGLDMIRKAGNAWLEKQTGFVGMEGAGGASGWKGINSVGAFVDYWNRVNPQWKQYAQRFGTIVSRESTFNPRAINHIGLGHAGWYQYDPPTWRAYDQGAGDPSWPGGPFNPGLATQHTGTMLDHEGASTFSRWAATDPGAMHGGIIKRAKDGGEIRIPGFDSKHPGAFVFPKYFRRIRKGVKGAISELGKIIGLFVDDENEWGLSPDMAKGINDIYYDKDLYAELAGVANTRTTERPIAASPTPGPGAPLGFEEGTMTILGLARGDDEGEWLHRQLQQLYGLRIALMMADEFMAAMAAKIRLYIKYFNKQLRIRQETLKALQKRLKPLKAAYRKAKGEHKRILKKRLDWYNDNIKGEQRLINYMKGDRGLSLLESEEDAAKSGREGIASSLEGIQGLSGIGGEILDVQQSIASFNEMAANLVDREPVSTAEDSGALRIDELIRFAEAIRLGASLPRFGAGGVVPGAPGTPQQIVAHGREVVFREDQLDALGGRGPMYADIYIGGEKIDERVDVRMRGVERASDLRRRAGVAPGV